ncbi:MAG: TIGR03000 domain-containing protein [Planctomycetaceae bacterium]
MVSFKKIAGYACLAAVLSLGASNAEAKKYKNYGSSGSSGSEGSASHGSSGSSSSHHVASHGSSGSSSSHHAASHGSSGSSSSRRSASHGSNGSSGGRRSASHGSSGSSSSHHAPSHGSSGSSSSHGAVIIHAAPAAAAVSVQPATLLVQVPADATVYLMDQKMSLTGTQRQYSIPLQQAGVDFTYRIRVEVVRDGKTLVSSSEQNVRAGQKYVVAVSETAENSSLVTVAGR